MPDEKKYQDLLRRYGNIPRNTYLVIFEHLGVDTLLIAGSLEKISKTR
jgi:hypothetical protein